MSRILGRFFTLLCFTLLSYLVAAPAFSQQNDKSLGLARQFVQNKEYEKAIPLFKQLYEQAPFDKSLYEEYLNTLLAARQFDTARELVSYMAKIRRGDPVMEIDMGRVFLAADKQKEANKRFEAALDLLQGDELVTKRMADAFEALDQLPFAIKTYEYSRRLMQNPYMFATELSILYGKTGATEAAINALLDIAMSQSSAMDEIKSSLSGIIEADNKKMALLQKAIAKRLAQVPHHPALTELNSWMYTRKGDYAAALTQIISLDKKLEEAGLRVMDFGRQAAAEHRPDIALQAFDYVLQNGQDHPYYTTAMEAKLNIWKQQLDKQRPIDAAAVHRLIAGYRTFLQQHPEYYTQPLIRDYARVVALYLHQPDTAIAYLQQALESPGMRKEMMGQSKLDMGDYYVLQGNVWEATLIYSQVDKAFKEDILGEEARFRNAKLAYYRGDFDWAQTQLSVLKASTTELIANDALYLSVLITENKDADSAQVALLRFAAADLLLFQHKTTASDKLLDSIATAFPKSALQDDIHMLRAGIATEEGRYEDAVGYLEQVLNNYGDDVLGDDAAYKLALLYDERWNDPGKAKKYYEMIVVDYPGSTYVQTARMRYQQLNQQKGADQINP